jgi:uncharacterized protein YndB with AHSA1/START domain
MRRILKWLIGVVALTIIVIVAGGYLLPGEAVVQRQVTINAPPEKVFAIIGNMKRFNEWSPWAELDPDAQYTIAGTDTGTGQKLSWVSNNPNIGSGSQTIVDFVENRRIGTELDFGDMGKAMASLELAPVGGGTGVTWGFKSQLNGIMERWFGLLFDRWIGADYEKGLAKLKALAEKEASGG